jgi:ABC-type nitrate/sulfonate/bicarbonate transport system substrate-binding protein
MRRLYAVLAAAAAMMLAMPSTAEPVKIRISWSTTPSHITPLLPLIPKDVYRHWGKSYVIEPVFLRGSGPMLTALAAGETEIAGFGYQSFALSVISAKLDTRGIVGLFANKPPNADNGFWVKTDAGIDKVEDLRGKNLAVNARGSGIDASLRKVMKEHGLKDGQDYQIVEVRFAAMLPSLKSGRVDMAFLVLPFDLVAEKDAGLKKLFTMRDALGPNETVVWSAKADFVAKNRAALVDMIEDNIRARRWLTDPKNHEAVIALLSKVTKVPAAHYRGWVFTDKDTYRSPDATFDVGLLQKNVDDLHRLGVTPGTIDVRKYTDLSLVEEAKKRLSM